MNNQQAKIQVGTQIPVNQTYFTGGINSSNNGGVNALGQVSYKDTGVILEVRPRVNPGGLVYLNLDQVVSKPGIADKFGNFPIDKRELNTQIAVQSGQTVLLGGLIQQDEGKTDTGIPGLNRIPVIGRLFGTTSRHRNRTELIVLITPRVITSSSDAQAVTEEYASKFESLAPLRKSEAKNKK
jgi:general secretion pathway protein D